MATGENIEVRRVTKLGYKTLAPQVLQRVTKLGYETLAPLVLQRFGFYQKHRRRLACSVGPLSRRVVRVSSRASAPFVVLTGDFGAPLYLELIGVLSDRAVCVRATLEQRL